MALDFYENLAESVCLHNDASDVNVRARANVELNIRSQTKRCLHAA